MRKLISIISILTIFILSNNFANATHGGNHAAKGNADVYKVTMRKVEMCEGYSVVDLMTLEQILLVKIQLP